MENVIVNKAFTCLKHLYSISPVYSFAEKVKIQILFVKKKVQFQT